MGSRRGGRGGETRLPGIPAPREEPVRSRHPPGAQRRALLGAAQPIAGEGWDCWALAPRDPEGAGSGRCAGGDYKSQHAQLL